MVVLKEKIIERMQAQRLSISKLEQEAGLTIHSLRNVLKGRIKKPRFDFLVAIAKALECSPLDFMEPTSVSKIPEERGNSVNNKVLFLDSPKLMMSCAHMIVALSKERKVVLSIDHYLEIVKALYCYSLSAEPKIPDIKFAKWLMENNFTFNHH